MPQMAPISWLFLFFFFTITFMLFCTINYTSEHDFVAGELLIVFN